MKGSEDDRSGTARELLFAALLLALYGLAIFGPADPEWVLWAGPMAVGALDVSSTPPLAASAAPGTLQTAAGLSVLGALAAALLAAGAGSVGWRWIAKLTGAGVCDRSHRLGTR